MRTIARLVLSLIPEPVFVSNPNADDDNDPEDVPATPRDAAALVRRKAARALNSKPITLLIDESDGVLSIRIAGDAMLSSSPTFDVAAGRDARWPGEGGVPMCISVEEP